MLPRVIGFNALFNPKQSLAMKKLQFISIILFAISFGTYLLWRFVLPLPDWCMRAAGIVMLVTIFTSVFSSVRLSLTKNNTQKGSKK